jgi:signal transduction histidine kinase
MSSTFAVGEPHTARCRKTKPTHTYPYVNLRNEVTLGTLAMSIVHDLRNPLAAIHLGAQMLNSSQLTEQHVRRLARNIYNDTLRIQELLQDYLELCLTRERRPQPSNLRSLIAQVVKRIATVAEAQSVALVQDVPGDLLVTLDPRRIDSVLTNLLVNALDAMPAGGSIHISAIAAEGSVVIKVLDTGPGIAPEIRDRLFEPFVTARKPNGWGLGLAQAREVVIDHGGEIWLESPPGGGACFAFSLPASLESGQNEKREHPTLEAANAMAMALEFP